MLINKTGAMTRRSLLKSTAAAGAALAVGTGGVSLFNVRSAYSQNLPNPADVLAKINVGNMVRKDYREQYKLGDNDELWDPKKDWIRTVDWEAVRKEHAGKTVRFAIGAADRESAQEQIEPFAQLSGIKIELVAIPDDSMYDKVVAEFLSGNASFDAIQFFSPWLGDFAAQGFLKPLDEYISKWGVCPSMTSTRPISGTTATGLTRACSAFPSTATSSRFTSVRRSSRRSASRPTASRPSRPMRR
jgi:multiple sugar transport system substrate-binding protein